jgi:hypothetical protein
VKHNGRVLIRFQERSIRFECDRAIAIAIASSTVSEVVAQLQAGSVRVDSFALALRNELKDTGVSVTCLRSTVSQHANYSSSCAADEPSGHRTFFFGSSFSPRNPSIGDAFA